jgi:hypothetical protein
VGRKNKISAFIREKGFGLETERLEKTVDAFDWFLVKQSLEQIQKGRF